MTWNINATFFACPLDASDASFNVFTASINDACEGIVLQIQPAAEENGESCPSVTASVSASGSGMGVENTSSMSKTTITLTVPFSRTATGTASAVASYKPESAANGGAVPGFGVRLVGALMGALGAVALGLW